MAHVMLHGKHVELENTGNCPACNASWDAGSAFDALRKQEWCQAMSDEELREYLQKHYGNENARFSRLIGIEVRGLYDGVCKWRCPDCNAEWERAGIPRR